LAVIPAAVVAFGIGGVWYTALFGKQWVKLNSDSDEQVKQLQARRPPPVFFGGMIAGYLVLALVLALLIAAMPEKTALSGPVLGVLVGSVQPQRLV